MHFPRLKMTFLNGMLNILGLLRVTPIFHQYVETVSISSGYANLEPLASLPGPVLSQVLQLESAHSSTDSGHADTRYSPDEILDAHAPSAETKRPHCPV